MSQITFERVIPDHGETTIEIESRKVYAITASMPMNQKPITCIHMAGKIVEVWGEESDVRARLYEANMMG